MDPLPGFHVRRMKEIDLPCVMEIERLSFNHPWSRQSFEGELAKEYGVPLVALVEGRIVGYLIYWLVMDEIHIANVAVHPDWRKQGIGECLIRMVIDDGEGYNWVGLEVRDSNTAARALYEKLGFCKVGIRENYYEMENEDAILMVKWLESNV